MRAEKGRAEKGRAEKGRAEKGEQPTLKRYALLAPLAILLYVAGATILAAVSPARGVGPSVLSASATPGDGWNVAGTIEQMNGEFWNVQGFVFRVTAATKVRGDVPSVGTYASATGIVLPDGSWQATAVTVGQAPATPAGSATPSVTDTPIAPTPTSTPVPTTLPPASPTVTVPSSPPTPAPVARPGSPPSEGGNGPAAGVGAPPPDNGGNPRPPAPPARHILPPHPAHGHPPGPSKKH
jgi:hypothetical protein